MPDATRLLPTTLTLVMTGTTFKLLVLAATVAAPGALGVGAVAAVAEAGTAPRAPDVGPVPTAPGVVTPPSVPDAVTIPSAPELVAAISISGVVTNRLPTLSRLIAKSLPIVVMDFRFPWL